LSQTCQAQNGFVADHDALDVAHLACGLDEGIDLAIVLFLVAVEPGAGGDEQVAFACDGEQARQVGDAVGAQVVGCAGEQVEVATKLGIGGIGAEQRALVTLKTVVGESLDALGRTCNFGTTVELLPEPVLCECNKRGDGKREGQAVRERGGVFHV